MSTLLKKDFPSRPIHPDSWKAIQRPMKALLCGPITALFCLDALFCFFFFNSSCSYFNGFLSLAVLLVTVVRRVKDIFRFVDRVQPVKVKSVCKAGEREGYLSLPSLRCFMNMFTALSLVCENCAEVHYD